MADAFRWQQVFQDARGPVFFLDRKRRLVFANSAWERLTGLSFADARGMTCTQRKSDSDLSGLGRTLSPTPEALAGRASHVRRPMPFASNGPPWWDIDFLPLTDDDGFAGLLGRITVIAARYDTMPRRLTEVQAALRERSVQRWRLDALEGRFPSLAPVLSQARLAAKTHSPVAILGERGVGKRWLARAIHYSGDRRDRPFIELDVAALPQPAVAGVLFGPLGVYRTDGAGAIALHEPQRLTLDAQDELAQRLADGTGTGPHILATFERTDDLDKLVADGLMLPALHAALAVIVIRLPPVRDRRGELNAMVEVLLGRAGAKRRDVSPEAWACLQAYSWPGNLVELQSALRTAIERVPDGVIGPDELPLVVRQAQAAAITPPPAEEKMPALDTVLEQVERRMIRLALEKANGNQTRAAELLSIWRPRLIRRVKALGLDKPAE